VLEAVFGDQAVRSLASRARDALLRQVDALLAADAQRFEQVLADAAPPPEAITRFHSAVLSVQAAR